MSLAESLVFLAVFVPSTYAGWRLRAVQVERRRRRSADAESRRRAMAVHPAGRHVVPFYARPGDPALAAWLRPPDPVDDELHRSLIETFTARMDEELARLTQPPP